MNFVISCFRNQGHITGGQTINEDPCSDGDFICEIEKIIIGDRYIVIYTVKDTVSTATRVAGDGRVGRISIRTTKNSTNQAMAGTVLWRNNSPIKFIEAPFTIDLGGCNPGNDDIVHMPVILISALTVSTCECKS